MDKHWRKKIAFFLSGQAISLLGSSLVQYAIIWHVTLETDSGLMVTLMTVFSFLPQVLISLFSGVWADRYDRKRLIIIADGSIALSTLVLVFIIINSESYYWALIVISGIRSMGAGIQTPAVNAIIPQIVPRDKLMRISGINGSIQSLMGLVSPIVAAGMLSVGIQYILLVDVFTAVIGIGILLCIHIPVHEKALLRQRGGYLDDLKTGVRYGAENHFLRKLFIISALVCFFMSPALILNVLFVTREFGGSEWYLTLNEISFFVGAIAGGLIISTWGGFDNRLKTLSLGSLGFAVTITAVGIAQSFWLYLVIMVFCGLVSPFINSSLMVIVQEKVDTNMQGRMFSIVQIGLNAVMPLSIVLFGPLADVINIRYIMIGSGISIIPVILFAMRDRNFYNAGQKPVSEPANPEAIPE